MDPVSNQTIPKKFILIAEDDNFFSKVLLLKLSNAGYDVLVTNNGNDLLLEAKKRKPDLILLDLIMPQKDGFQTLQEIKQDINLKGIKVIITSTLEQPEDKAKTQQLGADGYLNKTSLPDIVNQVKSFL